MDISKLIYSECQNPQKVRIYNGVINAYEVKNLPCGKCYHCKITRINEWVTRMVIQSKMSNYVYYGTLTYNGKKPTIYNDECLSMISTFNKTNTPNDTPIILRKDHLQKFFKRLRKNTKVKFQYAACGEYGSTYSRPHYHYIIWSNQPITTLDVYKAWTAPTKADPTKKAVIGKVEHRDIKHNAYPAENDPDNTAVFKYVCKYIQKSDFKFENITNLKQHYQTYEKEINPLIQKIGDRLVYHYIGKRIDKYLWYKGIKSFYDYQKAFSPFFVCSKKPAIGYDYLQNNLGEFQKGNFRLFGISGKYIFPLYFIRKAKESLCPLKMQSTTNGDPTTYSSLPKVETLLAEIKNAQQIAEDTDYSVQLFRYNNQLYTIETTAQLYDLEQLYDEYDKSLVRPIHYRFKKEYLSIYDTSKKVLYQFDFDHYNILDYKGNKLGETSFENILTIIKYYYEQLKRNILRPLYAKSTLSANQKEVLINECGGIDEFEKKKKQCLEQLNSHIQNRQTKYQQSKTFD